MQTETNTRQVTLNELKKYAMHNFKTKRPMFVWGPPGIGKSETFEQIKEAYIEQGKKAHLIDCRLALWDPTDLKGYPYFDQTANKMRFSAPDDLPDEEMAKEYDIPVLFGVRIASVNDGGGADDAGLEEGDVVVAINDNDVKNVSNLQEMVAINRPGDKIKVTYIRDGKTKTTNATLKNTLGTTEVVASTNSFSIDGAKFADVPKDLKEKLEIDGGAQVAEIENGKWKSSGITKGFIVTSINKRDISDVEDLSSTLSQLPKDDGVLVEGVYPNGVKAYYGIGW